MSSEERVAARRKPSKKVDMGYLERLAKPKEKKPEPPRFHPKPTKGSWSAPKGGVKFSESKAKSDLDWAIYRAKQLPAPNQYGAPDLPQKEGVKFSTAYAKSDVDWQIYRASQMPGPGQYGDGNKFSTLTNRGGGFSLARPKSELEWIECVCAHRFGHLQPRLAPTLAPCPALARLPDFLSPLLHSPGTVENSPPHQTSTATSQEIIGPRGSARYRPRKSSLRWTGQYIVQNRFPRQISMAHRTYRGKGASSSRTLTQRAMWTGPYTVRSRYRRLASMARPIFRGRKALNFLPRTPKRSSSG